MHELTFFKALPVETSAALLRTARRITLAKDDFLFYQDDPATRGYVLLTGSCRLSVLSIEGHQTVIRIAGAGEEIGLIAALPGATYPLTAQAMQACALLCWDGETLRAIMEQHPVLALHVLRVISGRFVELQRQYHELATERIERRIARALLRLVNHAGRRIEGGSDGGEGGGVLIDLPLKRQDVAELTGTTLYTASRVISSLEARGILDTRRERVIVLQPHALVRIAEDLPE